MDFRVAEVEPQIAVGRICCDADGRLNQNSILLQVRLLATGILQDFQANSELLSSNLD
jgi:hypothetical protein